MKLPNIYGGGAGFGYSGLEGPNGGSGLAGTLAYDRIGVTFELTGRQILSFDFNGKTPDIQFTFVVNDTITAQWPCGFIKLAMSEHRALIGCCAAAKPIVIAADGAPEFPRDGCYITRDGTGATALYMVNADEGLNFAFAYDAESEEVAVARAKQAVQTDLEALIRKRKAFYETLPACEFGDDLVERAYYKAISILRHNVKTAEGLFKGIWTTPDRLPHRHMWLWDSAFHSFGLCAIDEKLALRAVEAVLERQREDGFIAHMFTSDGCSDITQPPTLAWALERYAARTGDYEAVRPLLPKLHAYLEWDFGNRDQNDNMLCEWFIEGDPRCRSGESGMDNSQRFDNAAVMDAVDFSCFMKNEYDCLANVEEKLGLTESAGKSRETAEKIAAAVNGLLWNEDLGFYTDRLMDSQLSGVMACSGFLPLWAGIATKERAEKLAAHLRNPNTFATPLPVPSAAACDPEYGTDMWRGSVWINYNYMIIHGLKRYGFSELAREIIEKTVKAIADWYGKCGAIYEFYHAENTVPPQLLDRKGPCSPPVDIRRKAYPIADYGWSAALYAALINENNGRLINDRQRTNGSGYERP